MQGTLRTCTDVLRDDMIEKIRTLVEQTCAAHGAQGQLDATFKYIALDNNSVETHLVARLGGDFLGKENVVWKKHPSMGVEDFFFLLKNRLGCFYHLGYGPASGEWHPLHSSKFTLNEDCLTLGVAMQVGVAVKALECPGRGQ